MLRESENAIVQTALDLWHGSGKKYTCAAVVYDVVDEHIKRECARFGLFKSARKIRNVVLAAVHDDWKGAIKC